MGRLLATGENYVSFCIILGGIMMSQSLVIVSGIRNVFAFLKKKTEMCHTRTLNSTFIMFYWFTCVSGTALYLTIHTKKEWISNNRFIYLDPVVILILFIS